MRKSLVCLLGLVLLLGLLCLTAMADVYGDFVYEVYDGEVTIYDYTGSATEVVVPATIDGYPVTSLGDDDGSAFEVNDTIIRVTLPDTITYFPSGCFGYCTSLEEINMPASLKGIDMYCFTGCKSLQGGLVIPEGCEYIGEWAFRGCDSLESVTLPVSWVDYPIDAEIYFPDTVYGYRGTLAEKLCDGFVALPEDIYESGDYAYILENGGCTIIDYTGSASELVVPSKIDGRTVTAIREGAFYQCGASKVTIPGSVRRIGGAAFRDSEMTELVVSEGVAEIGAYAFSWCDDLEEAWLPVSVKSIGGNAFDGEQWDLEAVVVEQDSYAEIYCLLNSLPYRYTDGTTPEPLEYGIEDAGDGGVAINGYYGEETSIVIPSEIHGFPVTSISSFGDEGDNLKSITIPETVANINVYLLSEYWRLSTINVSSENPYFCSINGALFNKEATQLIMYPGSKPGKAYEVPTSVTGIGDCAFYYNEDIKVLVLNDGIKEIGDEAFSTSGVSSLKDVVFFGKPSQWEAIDLGWDNDILTSATLHCIVNKLTLPSDLTTLESEAFAGLTGGTAVVVPNTLKSIDSDAFGSIDVVLMADAGSYAATWGAEHDIPVIDK